MGRDKKCRGTGMSGGGAAASGRVPIDGRNKLEEDPFSYRATKSGKVLISRGGRQISVIAGNPAEKLLARLAATRVEEERQLLLAKATGNYRHGNERPS